MLLALGIAAPAGATNRIVALVNDEVITEGDIAIRMSGLLQDEGLDRIEPGQAAALREAVVQRLLEERLILQEAKRLGLRVPSEDVLDRLKGIRERVGGEERYKLMLAQLSLNEEQFKIKLREQLLVQEAIDQQVRAKITVTPAELAQAKTAPEPSPEPSAPVEEVEAYHLLIRVTDQRSAEDARALAEQLYQRMMEGADFAELAQQHSEGPHAESGGSLGWLRPGELLPELDDVLFRLQPGDVSSPLQTRLGYHLLMVTQRRPVADGAPARDPRPPAEARLYQDKYATALRKWIDGLRQKAYIELLND
jgi:peptidyl-prolyl cis-trans isomerase SurA